MNTLHHEILEEIKKKSGKPTAHTFLDSYLGNSHPRYPIGAPVLRTLAKEWMRSHRHLSASAMANLFTSLIEGESATEKSMAGILMDYTTREQRTFNPKLFDRWLDHLIGWAEVDAVCTGKYTITEIPAQWKVWKPLLVKFSKSKNIHKRRASLVLFCSPVSQVYDERLAEVIFQNINRLKAEKEILITKAISWVLRSMVKHYKKELTLFMKTEAETLPAIARRETMVKLKTGRKSLAVNR
ncbi:MAG TPA: DNA alkylation repair protein [Ohtaekwangia sp.]